MQAESRYNRRMNKSTPVTQHLDQLGIPYTTFRHTGPVNSLEQAAAERDQSPEQVVRTIVFRLSETAFVLALMAGPRQIDWKALRRLLGQSRVTMASEEEVLVITGYERGAVAPFGLPQPLPVLVDESVLAQEIISIGSGVRGTAVILQTADLLRALPEAQVVQL
jgi:Cys-tRNA(Pro) deacylase